MSEASTISFHTVHLATQLLEDDNRIPERRLEESVVGLSRYQTPGTLDDADLFALLVDPTQIVDAEREQTVHSLRAFFHYPETDPEGIGLSFEQITLGASEGILSLIRIKPNSPKENAYAIHMGGIFHPTSAYLPACIEYAKQRREETILIDSPGTGYSPMNEGISSSAQRIYEAYATVLNSLPGNARVVAFAHSLGTVALRELEDNLDRFSQHITLVPMGPLPAMKEATTLDPAFMRINAAAYVGTGARNLRPAYRRVFYQDHGEEEVDRFENETVLRQRYRISLPNFVGVLHFLDRHPWDTLGTNQTLIVYGEKDAVVPPPPGVYSDTKGALMLDSDHGIWAGEYGVKNVQAVVGALNEMERTGQPYNSEGEPFPNPPVDRGFHITPSVGFGYQTKEGAGGSAGLRLQYTNFLASPFLSGDIFAGMNKGSVMASTGFSIQITGALAASPSVGAGHYLYGPEENGPVFVEFGVGVDLSLWGILNVEANMGVRGDNLVGGGGVKLDF